MRDSLVLRTGLVFHQCFNIESKKEESYIDDQQTQPASLPGAKWVWHKCASRLFLVKLRRNLEQRKRHHQNADALQRSSASRATSAEIDQSTQVFNLHCELLVLMIDGWPLNLYHPWPPAEHTHFESHLANTVHEAQASPPVTYRPPAEWSFLNCQPQRNLTRNLPDSSERNTPVSKSSGRNRILPATREYQDHVAKTYTSVKQKVHAEVKRQQVFHIIWNTNLCCDKRLKGNSVTAWWPATHSKGPRS